MISVDIQPFERQLNLMMDVVRENVGYTQQTNWIDFMEEFEHRFLGTPKMKYYKPRSLKF
jgi:hypothetical protein